MPCTYEGSEVTCHSHVTDARPCVCEWRLCKIGLSSRTCATENENIRSVEHPLGSFKMVNANPKTLLHWARERERAVTQATPELRLTTWRQDGGATVSKPTKSVTQSPS
jgi:hypothetical protein